MGRRNQSGPLGLVVDGRSIGVGGDGDKGVLAVPAKAHVLCALRLLLNSIIVASINATESSR